MKAGKVWGTTEKIFRSSTADVSRLAVRAGAYCSRHHHAGKYNLFYVERGRFIVLQWPYSRGRAPDRTELRAGESVIVSPPMVHQFRALTNCVVYEICWTELADGDIMRESRGGP